VKSFVMNKKYHNLEGWLSVFVTKGDQWINPGINMFACLKGVLDLRSLLYFNTLFNF